MRDNPSIPEPPVTGGDREWRWKWPRLTIYRPADTRTRAAWNRYPGAVIGAAAVAFGRCWSLTWKRSR